jgi:hypothetical protein
VAPVSPVTSSRRPRPHAAFGLSPPVRPARCGVELLAAAPSLSAGLLARAGLPYVVTQAEWCGGDGGDSDTVLLARGGGALQPQFVAYVRAPVRAYPFAAGEWILHSCLSCVRCAVLSAGPNSSHVMRRRRQLASYCGSEEAAVSKRWRS